MLNLGEKKKKTEKAIRCGGLCTMDSFILISFFWSVMSRFYTIEGVEDSFHGMKRNCPKIGDERGWRLSL